MAQELLYDPWTFRYKCADMWTTYYTCVPVDKQQTSYECVKGLFDPTYSHILYPKSKNWLETSVPWYIPQAHHESWLNGKFKDKLLRTYKGSDPFAKN